MCQPQDMARGASRDTMQLSGLTATPRTGMLFEALQKDLETAPEPAAAAG